MTLTLTTESASRLPSRPVPLAIRVGITGHRHLPPESLTGLERTIDAALKMAMELFPKFGPTPISLCALSALAEGADRLVTRRVLATAGGHLEVALPMDRDRYVLDFEGDGSRRDFDDLLDQAVKVHKAPHLPTRIDGYTWASHQIVDRADVVLAVWDAQPSRGEGGTADSVRYALETCTPVVWVPTDGGAPVVDKGKGPVDAAFFATGAERTYASGRTGSRVLPLDRTNDLVKSLNRYNAVPSLMGIQCRALRPNRLAQEIFEETMGLPDNASDETIRQLADWIRPYFVWADRRSVFFQRWYLRGIVAEFVTAFLAVLLAAILLTYSFSSHLFLIEAFLLVIVLAVVLAGRRLDMHDQWLDCRFLAEKFRSTIFLKAAELQNRRGDAMASVNSDDSSESWLGHVYAFVSAGCPPVAVGSHGVLRQLLVESWIRPQTTYFSKTSDKHHAKQNFLFGLAVALFAGTILASIWHAIGIGGIWNNVVRVVTIALPAAGSAVAGISVHREHRRHAVVYARMAEDLGLVGRRMVEASTLPELKKLALIAGNTMSTENRDWLGVMRCHDFEISV